MLPPIPDPDFSGLIRYPPASGKAANAPDDVIDAMKCAGGIAYDEASRNPALIELDGVAIPIGLPSARKEPPALIQSNRSANRVTSRGS